MSLLQLRNIKKVIFKLIILQILAILYIFRNKYSPILYIV